VLLGGLNELEGGQLETALFEPGDDLSNEVALDAIRLPRLKFEWVVGWVINNGFLLTLIIM
jgi:hypothetical protein